MNAEHAGILEHRLEGSQVLNETQVIAALEQSLAMIEFNTNGEVIWANRLFADAMGYMVSELTGIHHRSFCGQEYVKSSAYQEFWSNLRAGMRFQEKVVRFRKDGQKVWLEATYMPVFQEDGQLAGILKIAADITERENNTTSLTSDLNHMSKDLLQRTHSGLARNQEVEAAIRQVVEDNESNAVLLQELERQTSEIQGIVSTIREFASQTNLLALNAAIEAAHAGEHGRGFNIVATEVRKLSGQVHTAAAAIQKTVETISSQVERVHLGMKNSRSGITRSKQEIQMSVNEFSHIGETAEELETLSRQLSRIYE